MSLNLINKLRLIRSQCCHYFARGGVSFVYHNIRNWRLCIALQISSESYQLFLNHSDVNIRAKHTESIER
jgi:hypothetical protein